MIVENVEQITPAWLTDVFTADGLLQRGEVLDVSFDGEGFNKGFVSNITRLTVRYSEDVLEDLPARFILKTSKPGIHAELLKVGRHEIDFYQAMERFPEHPVPIPEIYDAQYDPATERTHLLMSDLSATHFQRPLPIPPSNRHCEMIIDSLAQLHAFWWNHPLLGSGLGERLTQAVDDQTRARLEATLPAFLEYIGDGLLPQNKNHYERVLSSSWWDRASTRLRDLHHVTLTHGDTHTGNFMLPYDTERGRVTMIDWHLWGIDTATIDLAFLIALHWSPARRAVLEVPLLRRYHDRLTAHGVDYPWDALWNDYRSAVVTMTLIPIGQFRRSSPAGAIWFGLQDCLAAFDDLGCAELL